MTPDKTARYQAYLALCGADDDERAQTEVEEMNVACKALGRSLEDIVIDDDMTGYAPLDSRYMATWGGYDLDCVYGTGATPEQAIWDLIDFTNSK